MLTANCNHRKILDLIMLGVTFTMRCMRLFGSDVWSGKKALNEGRKRKSANCMDEIGSTLILEAISSCLVLLGERAIGH